MTTRFRPDGSCSLCIGGNNCEPCQQDGLAADRRQSAAIAAAVRSLREFEIARTCSRFELESDEFSTARQKAIRINASK